MSAPDATASPARDATASPASDVAGPPAFDAAAVPRFRRGVRLREDKARDRWVVMAPERAFVPDEVALSVLRLVDGARSVGAIVDDLAARFAAPRGVIEADVLELLRDLSARGVVSPA